MAWALKLPLTDEVIESGLVQDFDASLSGIGQELGAGAYSMRCSMDLGLLKTLCVTWCQTECCCTLILKKIHNLFCGCIKRTEQFQLVSN